ncbi:PepSY domain-containing protein [Peribacillus cavernae]|uniref:PepSY domain-containing protein n=1 Tax=Peribacillus cavernae TaxID=1674310 RepID=UPI00163CF59C|nr:hypothetical protein [Peribacillus cavernae]MDQ0218159.1 putative membrane protein YkoI [Peribacillus cavernae]
MIETELDKNQGTMVYHVIIDDGSTVKEITLNTNSGKVLKVAEDDDAEQEVKLLQKN